MPASTTASKSIRKVSRSKAFDAAYARLNEQQKQAVDTIEGPLMVVAGPGTGKTQVIALRTANILQKTQMRPSNILCLTFSVSGATAMRERLRHLIGPDAYGVTVKNFHGFCNDIIAEHPMLFEEWSALEQISDVERYRELNKIIDQLLPHCELVNRKNPYLRTREILGRISQLKREGVTGREQLMKIADTYEQEMATKSKEGTKVHERNVLTARKFRDLLEVFFRYQQMLTDTQRYDYDDMILYVLRALREEEWLLQSLQERFQYILVDEFQDTNGSQYQLLELLTQYASLDHEPNVCTVGDDDQAIYRFQGANLGNILAFRDRFPDAPVITLTTSYRCSQPILDAAGSLIANNTERLVGTVEGLTKDLINGERIPLRPSGASAGQGAESGECVPQLCIAPSDTTEPWMIADIIDERLKKGVEPQNIAILVQKNAELEILYDVLSAREIPVQMSGKVDLLNHHLVRECIAILRAIESPRENALLAAALACSCFSCHPADLGRLYAHLRNDDNEDACVHDLLLKLDDEQWRSEIGFTNIEKLKYARDCLMNLHQQLPNRTLLDTLEHVLKDSGLLPEMSKNSENLLNSEPVNELTSQPLSSEDSEGAKEEVNSIDPLDFAALQTFFDIVKYRAYEQPTFGIQTLLSDIEYYERTEYGELRLRYDLPHLTESGVQLMTAHQSKGLEFDVVILPNFRHGHWDSKRSPSSIAMPEDLLFGWESDQKKFEKTQDERRVTYVAMTRARHELIFTCPHQESLGDRTRDVSPSAFFAEAGDLTEEHRELQNPEQATELVFEPMIKPDEALQAFLRQRLENFSLSVTALNHFLEDPQKFLEIDLLQMPQAKQASLVYGNAVHESLKKWGLSKMKSISDEQLAVSNWQLASADDFLRVFTEYLQEREILTKAEKERLIALGEQNLPRYFDQRLAESSPVIYKVEYPISTLLGDVPIKGKIDRIDLKEPDSAIATIIDYKTGRPKSEKEIREGSYNSHVSVSDSYVLTGDYYRQLVFYSLLISSGASILKPEAFVLDFVGEGTDHPIERRFEVSESDRTDLTKVVEAVWTKIQNLDFSPL